MYFLLFFYFFARAVVSFLAAGLEISAVVWSSLESNQTTSLSQDAWKKNHSHIQSGSRSHLITVKLLSNRKLPSVHLW